MGAWENDDRAKLILLYQRYEDLAGAMQVQMLHLEMLEDNIKRKFEELLESIEEHKEKVRNGRPKRNTSSRSKPKVHGVERKGNKRKHEKACSCD